MNKRTLFYLGLVILSISLSNCAAVVPGAATGVATATDPRGFKGVVNDQTLEHDVNSVLSKQAPDGSYTVASFNNNVLIAGQVPFAEYKDKVYLAVKNTEGVKHIYNYLTIAKNESVSDISHDTYLTSLAKSRLFGQKGVNSNNIKVVTCANVVYLLGKDSGSLAQIDSAIVGIKQIDGVKDVVNLIKNK
jgi:osmotically-inducible protein OsmY